MRFYQLRGVHFTAGITLDDSGKCVSATPLVRTQYLGLTELRIRELCREKNVVIIEAKKNKEE